MTDLGKYLRCVVTASNASGSGTPAPSNVVGPVVAAAGDSAAATNFLARTSGLDTAHQNAYKALLNGLTTDGLFNTDGTTDYFEGLWVFATQNSTTALLNLVGNILPAYEFGSPPFVADSGYNMPSSGTNRIHIDAPVTPLVSSQTSYHLSAWGNGVSTGDSGDAGQIIGSSGYIKYHLYVNYFGGGTALFRAGSNSGPSFPSSGSGMSLVNRNGMNTTQGYHDGVLGQSKTDDASEGDIPNSGSFADIYRLPYDYGYAHPIMMCSFGASLTGTQVANFYARMHTYLQTIAGIA